MKSLPIAMQNSRNSISAEILAIAVFVLCVLASFGANAQTEKAFRQANDYLAKNKTSLGFTSTDIADIYVKDAYTDAHNGVTHVYVQQRYNGIEIKDAILGLHLQKAGDVLFVGNTFQKKLDTRLSKGAAAITPVQAVQTAAQSLGLQAKTPFSVLKSESNAAQKTWVGRGGISKNDIPAKLVYAVAADGSLRLVWEVEIYTLDAQNYYLVQVDARSGEVLGTQDLVIKCQFDHGHSAECGDHGSFEMPAEVFSQEKENISSVFEMNPVVAGNFYRVYNAPTEAPTFGSRTLVNTSGDPVSSPLGWHYDGYVPYTITKGNNVYAYEDKNGVGAGTSPNGGLPNQSLFFDFPINFSQQPTTYTNAAVTNLFFWNNYVHDVMYRLGGDAQSGAPAITIPSVMISYEDGLELKDEIALGSVTIALKRLTPAPPMKDGDLDNGIVAHEYGHGISTRLTGGPNTNCLNGDEQAGEGWSDYFAMVLTMNPASIHTIAAQGRGVGSYVFDQPTTGLGIRPAKYSTDMNVNPYTYADIANTEISVPHGVGFIFATALWEMTWNLIDEYGYDTNIKSGNLSKGNILALQLVIDGLKLQPCSPTFLQSRDAILAADQALTDGANQCLIWEAFAKRGMGFSAVSGTNARGNEIEAFDLPESCLANVNIVKSAPATVNNGQQMTYTLTVSNTGAVTATGVVVTDPLPAGTSYVAGSASNGGSVVNGVVTYPIFNLNPGQTAVRTFSVTVNTATSTNLQFFDNLEDGINQWTPSVGLTPFTYSGTDSHSGDFAWFVADPDNASNQTLDIANAVTLPTNAQLRFWHKFNTEAGFDGGVVELSNDGGLTWINLGSQITQNGYNDFVPAANNPLINGFAFGGGSNGWIETVVNLGIFANQDVIVRFRFSSDVATPSIGWYIDDVVIGKNVTQVHNTAAFVTAGNLAGTSSVSTLVLAPGQNIGAPTGGNGIAPPQALRSNLNGDLRVTAFPNPAKDLVNLKLDGTTVGDLRVQILGAQGQLLNSLTIPASEVNPVIGLDVTSLPTGMYWVNLRDDASAQTVKVFIEQQ